MRELKSIVNDLKVIAHSVNSSEALNLIEGVSNSLNRSKFNLAVLGEFKRGKSTLINSLLGQNLLTADVLPATAVVTIINYSEDEKCIIHWLDSSKEQTVLGINELDRISVQGDIDVSLIKFVEVNIKNEFLKGDITIIDTPGVNDISKTRIEITNNILPHCDAALFLLDAAAPVTKSEGDFLVTKVLNNKLDSLLFIISKSDRLDEDELEESIEGARTRLREVLGREMKVLTYSSKNVIKKTGDKNEAELQKQNLISNISALKELSRTSKRLRSIQRLSLSIEIIENSLEVWQAFLESSEDQIKRYKEKFEAEQTEYNIRLELLISSINKVGRETLIQLFEKSLSEFQDRAIDEFSYQLRIQDGNVEKMYKQVIPIQLEKSLKYFSENKAEEIKNYLLRFNNHVVKEYERNFKMPLIIKMQEHSISLPQWVNNSNSYTAENSANKIIKSSLPYVAGAVITSVLLPHLAVAALIGGTLTGTLSSVHSLKNNESLRERCLIELPNAINEILGNYKDQAIAVINSKFDELIKIVRGYHSEQMESINEKISLRLGTKESSQDMFSESEIKNIKARLYELKLLLSEELI